MVRAAKNPGILAHTSVQYRAAVKPIYTCTLDTSHDNKLLSGMHNARSTSSTTVNTHRLAPLEQHPLAASAASRRSATTHAHNFQQHATRRWRTTPVSQFSHTSLLLSLTSTPPCPSRSHETQALSLSWRAGVIARAGTGNPRTARPTHRAAALTKLVRPLCSLGGCLVSLAQTPQSAVCRSRR